MMTYSTTSTPIVVSGGVYTVAEYTYSPVMSRVHWDGGDSIAILASGTDTKITALAKRFWPDWYHWAELASWLAFFVAFFWLVYDHFWGE